MVNDMTLEIKNVGPIADAKIDVGKINIVGGVNSTGKSTSSKLLYCFLKANAEDRKELAAPIFMEKVDTLKKLASKHISGLYNNDTGHEILFDKDLLNAKLEALLDDKTTFEGYVKFYNDLKETYFSDEIKEILIKKDSVISDAQKNIDKITEEMEVFRQNNPVGTDDVLNEYNSMWLDSESYKAIINVANFGDKIESGFDELDKFIEGLNTDSDEVFKQCMLELLFSEFGIESSTNFGFAELSGFSNSKFNFKIDFKNFNIISQGWLDGVNVFYLGAYSFFDFYFEEDSSFNNEVYIPFHAKDLKKYAFSNLKKSKFIDNHFNKDFIEIENIINEIIGGDIVPDYPGFKFVTPNFSSSMLNTSSGVKQIAIIQALLKNRPLKEDTVLIIDEPEVNLHPEWQIKLAEILVLLAKKLDVIIYINSHSPMFIEAIDTYSEIYSIDDEVNYYLTHKSESHGYDIIKIDNHDLGIIYDNLGNPYDILDKAKLQKPRI